MTRAIRALAAGAFLCAAGAAPGFPIITYPTPVVEYYNATNGHYLLLSDPAEISGVENGAAGAGWKSTGYYFYPLPTTSTPNVCRFYAPGPNSHFFTLDPAECAFLKTHDTGWLYEKLDFAITAPAAGACAADDVPIYRLYNNRAQFNDSNHRFTPDPLVRGEMIARGWVDEGVGFCSSGAGRSPAKTYTIATEQVRPSAECEDESINLGACIALNQVPRLTNKIVSWQPPSYVTKDPLFSPLFVQVTGFDGNVYTAQSAFDPAAVATHSFAQSLLIAPSEFGVHVSYLDRTSGQLASINPLYQFTTTGPAAGAPDRRVFPWNANQENDLLVAFDLEVKMIRRHTADSQAYGHPTLQFLDTRGGNVFYVTLQAYGTGVPGKPGDFVALDTGTGRVIVSTAFRDDPKFGRRIAGNFLHCDGDAASGGCGQTASDTFIFRLGRADFQAVLDLARTANPRLSANPVDYILANFHFNNEIYLGGEIGAHLRNYRLELFAGY